MSAEIITGDVLEFAAAYEGPLSHALLCDPPYELGFMSAKWDKTGIAFRPETWAALGKLLHPGAFIMAFCGSRGWHRQAVAIEDAGLIMHPSLFRVWATGQGFPKASRIDTQIDKAAGAERESVEIGSDGAKRKPRAMNPGGGARTAVQKVSVPATDAARVWAGHRYGAQALKPAAEPVLTFSKPDICYNETSELAEDTAMLLEELWTRFADTAESITRAEQIVRTALNNVATTTQRSVPTTFANVAGKPSSEDQRKSEKALGSTARAPAKTSEQENGTTAPIAESGSISAPLPFQATQASSCTAADPAIPSTELRSEQELASSAATPSQAKATQVNDTTAHPLADTHLSPGHSLRIPCETETDTDTRVAILQYNSERARLDLSTIWLWSIVWDDLCNRESKCITATALKTTTALRTLNSSLRRLMLFSRDIASQRNSSDKLWLSAADVNAKLRGYLESLKELASSALTAANRPAAEPILCFQVPYKGRPVDSITRTGAGALNINAARIEGQAKRWVSPRGMGFSGGGTDNGACASVPTQGRWPANLCLDESGAALIDAQSGMSIGRASFRGLQTSGQHGGCAGEQPNRKPETDTFRGHDDAELSGASRYFHVSDWRAELAEPCFYTAKASRVERDSGLDGFDEKDSADWPQGLVKDARRGEAPRRNAHPTVKPIRLTRWLASLLLPPAEYAPRRILIPFAGSGSEAIGAHLAGWEEIVGVEMSAEYAEIASARVRFWQGHVGLFDDLTRPAAEPDQAQEMFELCPA